jgi:hypothetical protein
MGLSKITTNVGKDGLGYRAPNKDKISGYLSYMAVLPAGFGVNDRVKKVYSLSEAEALGIAKGSVNHAVHHYHISEFFRMNPEGELWIGCFAVPAGAYDFAEIGTMMMSASAEVRQLGIYAEALAYLPAQVTTIQTVINGLDEAYRNFKVLYAPNNAAVTAVTGWAGLADNRTLNAPDVCVVLAESGSGTGKSLADSNAYSITALGTALGCMSAASVEESIGWVERFNLSNGTEFESVALANGDLITSISSAVLGGLKDKGYLVARKYTPDITGSYFERCPTSVPLTNDLAWMEVGRTLQKAIRGVRSSLAADVQRKLYVNEDGTLRKDTVGYFENKAQKPLTDMEAEGECSAALATVDPTQNVVSTSKLAITIKVVPVGTAETIEINIGLALKL